MVYKTISTTVDVDLDDFEDEELQDELNRRRGWQSDTDLEDLLETWVSRRDRFEDKFRDYCREILGRSF